MSIKVQSAVWELALKPSPKYVLLALADHADDFGNNVYPSTEYVAWKTGFDSRSVRRIIDTLEETGLLIAVRRRSGKPVEYRIDTSKGVASVPFEYRNRREPLTSHDATNLPLPSEEDEDNSADGSCHTAPKPVTPDNLSGCQNVTPDNLTPDNLSATPDNLSQTPDILSVTPDSLSPKPLYNHKEPSGNLNIYNATEGEGGAKKKTRTPRSAAPAFVPPSQEEAETHLASIGAPGQGEAFWAHHDARGWKLSGGKVMVSWRSACVTWKVNAQRFAPAAKFEAPTTLTGRAAATAERLKNRGHS